MRTGFEGYDVYKCTPPFNLDVPESEEPCEACEREVEELTAEIGERDKRLEALEIEVAALRQHSDLARMVEEVGRSAPGSYAVSLRHCHYLGEYGTLRRLRFEISWWPTESGSAQTVSEFSAAEALAKFHADLAAARETRS